MTVDSPCHDEHLRPLTVVVLEDCPRLRVGLVRALDKHPDVGRALAATDPGEAGAMLESLQADVLPVDVRTPGTGGQALPRGLRSIPKSGAVVVVAMSAEPAVEKAALKAGAAAFVDKAWSRLEICTAVVRAARGGTSDAEAPSA